MECEDFITTVLILARAEDKLRDNDWIVDFVSCCFVGEARRWYEELEEEIQQDWSLLRRALIRKYSWTEERRQRQVSWHSGSIVCTDSPIS